MEKFVQIFAILALMGACSSDPAAIRVIDGDTIEYRGNNVRLMGYDTPETYRPDCAAEQALGEQATARLQQLINTADRVRVQIDDPNDVDRYNRQLGRVLVDGRDAGQILIAEGLARPYTGGRRESWCTGLAT